MFFHNAISLNISSVVPHSQEARLNLSALSDLQGFKIALLAHLQMPQSPLRLIFFVTMEEYVNIIKGF